MTDGGRLFIEHGAGALDPHVLDLLLQGRFEEIELRGDVVDQRVGRGLPARGNEALGGEVVDPLRPDVGYELPDGMGIPQLRVVENHLVEDAFDILQGAAPATYPVDFELAEGEEVLRQVTASKTGDACYQCPHR